MHHSRRGDVSWFRQFWCQATLFRGKDIVEHHKLAPRGEQGVMIGLGMAHGQKCWLVYCPQLNRIFESRNVTFDETMFPLKDIDQQVYGFYDNQAITRLHADAYCDALTDTPFQNVLNMPLPEQPSCTTCNFESITDQQFPLRNTIDVDAYADRNNANEIVAREVYGDKPGDEDDLDITDDSSCDNGKRARNRGGGDAGADGWGAKNSGGTEKCGGSKDRWGDDIRWGKEPTLPRPSVGAFRQTKLSRFSEAPG
eukprot:3524054-Rhodomonas_salina.1